jgi:hypothetical protein
MQYDDGYYKWHAHDDRDNPYYRGGNDARQLNRTEGYEVLYFINHFVAKNRFPQDLPTYKKVEKIIRYDVPSNIHKRELIAEWILINYSRL